jgi:hypothetical protein
MGRDILLSQTQLESGQCSEISTSENDAETNEIYHAKRQQAVLSNWSLLIALLVLSIVCFKFLTVHVRSVA